MAADDASAGRTPVRRDAAGRGRAVLVLLLLAGLAGLVTLPAWVTAEGANALGEPVAVTVRGSAAAPGIVAGALVLLAAAGAVGLVGRVGRWVVVAVVAAAGALVTGSALAARSGAASAAERAAADATGVASLAGEAVVAAWPVVAAAIGLLAVTAAAWLAVASGRWTAPSDRHERAVRADGGRGAVDRGTGAAGAPGDGGAGGSGGADTADERSTWDALSRGDDPT
ncbi:Trp biosynthesis-associated membrane protein [Cellulomonas sp. C5510]|uniref:Trp biosynthesis-associated membrane protein n=1 Tax=Cellulomonas sp. C5510 TaxID=2871170 RepID=UPI001C975931|nr:Trp biosynthesis-associated membrane protein [Cellulomonas sp. C5510]QZN84309.1 Trp biosynthesis-associated membrane protein [Cellulomonas sp. C5510]